MRNVMLVFTIALSAVLLQAQERVPATVIDHVNMGEFYDHVPFYRDRPDVAFYVDEAVKANGPVLEVACGSGRVLIPTARAGVSIVGLDRSAEMLARCTSSLEREPDAVRARTSLVHGDMRNVDLGRTCALVTIPFRAFQHPLAVEDQIACLTCVRRHMADNGRFIVDVFNHSLEMLVNKELGEEFDSDPPFALPDGRTVQRRARSVQSSWRCDEGLRVFQTSCGVSAAA